MNHPTLWTSKMMPHYRGMNRGLCSVLAICGLGMGHVGLLSRFKAAAVAQGVLGSGRFEDHGATDVVAALYRADYTLTATEIAG